MLNVLPTPALAYLVTELEANLGILVAAPPRTTRCPTTASSSSPGARAGLDDAVEDAIQATLSDDSG